MNEVTRKFVPLIGPAGSGKGTIWEGLKSLGIKNFDRVVMSDLLKGSKDPEVRKVMDNGGLVSDPVIWKCLREGLSVKLKVSDAEFIFLDGAVRTGAQADQLPSILDLVSDNYRIIPMVVSASDDVCKKRILEGRALVSGRPDDQNADTVSNRIKLFYETFGKYDDDMAAGTIAPRLRRISSLDLDQYPHGVIEIQNNFRSGDALAMYALQQLEIAQKYLPGMEDVRREASRPSLERMLID